METCKNENLLTEQINPVFNWDETNDFDVTPEKKPALSTMQSNLKVLNTRLSQAATISNHCIVQQFDKLKMWVDLSKHDEYLEFDFDLKTSAMFVSDKPEEPDTCYKEKKRLQKTLKQNYSLTNNAKDEIEYELDEEEEEITEDELIKFLETSNRKHKYPNCKILYSAKRKGLINLYIKNDILFIYLTGKFMWKYKKIDYLTKYNINEALQRVCDLSWLKFNVERFIELAGVYLCDVCIDLILDNVDKYNLAVSSIFPLSANKHMIRKYKCYGLRLKSKAEKVGSSSLLYHKGKEIRKSLGIIAGKTGEDIDELLDEYPDDIDNRYRIEVQIYSLLDMRVLLNISKGEDGLVKLTDVLNSQAKPILKRLEAFDATEEILRDKIALYVEHQEKLNTEKKQFADFKRILAAERIAELVKDNVFDLTRVKSHMITEYGFYDENYINALMPEIKENYWNFLLYRKPKAIKLLIDLLNKINIYYGGGQV